MIFFETTTSSRLYYIYLLVAFLFILASCTTIKNYPVNEPFVYQTNIKLQGKFTTAEKKDLLPKLTQQLHDSIAVRKVQKLVLFQTLRNPPVYDSVNAQLSVTYMRALLNSLGYYRDSITFDTSLKVIKGYLGKELRTTVNFNVHPGKLVHLDSISYTLPDSLQKITMAHHKESLLKKGDPFAKPLISSEFDRLADIYRNNGYLNFSRDQLLAVWDTVGIELLRPTLDPIEQAQQLQQLQKRRENPTADVQITLRADNDSADLIQYHIGNVTVYPDIALDTINYIGQTTTKGNVKVISYHNLFKPKVLFENIHLHHGDLYDQRIYLKTLNRFSSLGAWRLVTIDQIPRDSTDTVDFVVNLTPAKKYLFNANLEGSQNWGSVFTEGSLLGIGINIGLQNRNFVRGANQANTNFRFGTELGGSTGSGLVQTKQVTLGHTISFPRLVPYFKVPSRIENFKTIFALNLSNIDRVDYFNLTTLNSSWGYEFNWKNKLLGVRFPNIEYSFLTKRSSLQQLIDSNQSYKYIFNTGFVSSGIVNFAITKTHNNITNLARFNIEGSGFISGLFRSKFLDSNLYRFVKLDAEFRQTYKIRRSAFAWRFFSGIGYELPSTHNRNDLYMPFFKQYFAGGANSMRAWALRRLGPGSAIKSFSKTIAPDRFGDIQLELNNEYRFFITDISGVTINSALFADMGNVWFLRENADFPGGEFRFAKLWKDLAIGVGTGLRIDFGIFLIRLDYAYKAKDPSPDTIAKQNKWFYNWKWYNGQFQLGVNYPF